MKRTEYETYNKVTKAIADRIREVFPQLKGKASVGRLNALIQGSLEKHVLLPKAREALADSIRENAKYEAYTEAKKKVNEEHTAAHTLHLDAMKIKNEYTDKLDKLDASVVADQELAQAVRVLMKAWQKTNPVAYPSHCFPGAWLQRPGWDG